MGSCPSRSKRDANSSKQFRDDNSRLDGVARKSREANFQTTQLTNVCIEDNTLRDLTSKLKKALCWTSKHDACWSVEFSESVNELFVDACRCMSDLAESEDYGKADEIVKMILRLRTAWGNEAFEYLNIKSFPRERIETKNAVILAGQYFTPERFYEDDDRLFRLFYFEVREAETNEFMFTYYLECSNILQKFHVLCLSCSGGHLQITKYGKNCPCYWSVREDMLRDFQYKEDSALVSHSAVLKNWTRVNGMVKIIQRYIEQVLFVIKQWREFWQNISGFLNLKKLS